MGQYPDQQKTWQDLIERSTGLQNFCRTPGFRRRVVYGSFTAIVLSSVFRWVLAVILDVQMPLPAYSHPQLSSVEIDMTVRYYHSLYFSTPARIGNLATGVLLGLVLRNEMIGRYLKKHRTSVSFSFLAIFALFYQIVGTKKIFGTPSDSQYWYYPHEFTALAYHGSPLYCLMVAAIILAISLHAGWLGQSLANILSTKLIKHFSNVSYHMYRLHMTAFYWLEEWVLHHDELPSVIRQSPLSGYGTALICLWTAAYVVARLHMALHEKILYPKIKSLGM